MARRLLIASLACVFASSSVPARQAPSPPAQPSRIASGVTAVVVDAVVRDAKGKPVMDLRKQDFQLFEDGVQQEIGDVRVVMPGRGETADAFGGGATADTAAAANTPPAVLRARAQSQLSASAAPSFLAIVFDRLSAEARGSAYKGALSYLETLHDNDYAGVFVSDLTLRTLQPYTNDREKLRNAIREAAMAVTSPFDRAATKDDLADRDAFGNKLPGDAHPSVPVVASPESQGRPVDGRTLLAREVAAIQATAWEVMARDEQGYATTNALLAVTTALGTLPGRKSVVLFAEALSIPDPVLPFFRNVITTANRGNVSVYTIDAAGLRVHSKDAETGRAVRAMGAAGLTVDSTGANASSLRMLEYNEDVLRKDPRTSLTLLAQQTGGFLVENTNDLASAFRQIDSDRRFHYLLTYTPKNTAFNGEWRTISVKVPARKLNIRARTGYLAVHAPSNAPLLAYEGPALAALDRSPAPTDLPLRTAALVFPGSAQSQIAVLAATPGSALTFKRDDAGRSFRTDFTILARISDANGTVVRKASQPYRLSGPAQQREQTQRGEVLFFRQPSLDPGTYTLEIAVHDALAARAGVQRSTFEVPPSTPNALQVGSLVLVQRAERVPPGERQQHNPLYVNDVVVYPNLGEPLAKSRDKVVTFYIVVQPGRGAECTARLELVGDGGMAAKAPVVLPPPDASGRITYIAQVPIDTLAAGRYTLHVIVEQGDRREVREAAFRLID